MNGPNAYTRGRGAPGALPAPAWLGLAFGLLTAGTALAEEPSADVIVLRRCPVGFERTAAVGAPMLGLIQECLVQPGDRVKAGQVLGRLDDGEARAELRLRQLQADSVLEIRVSEAKAAQAQSKMRATASLLRRNAASHEEFNLHKAEADVATLQVEKAKHEHTLDQEQLRRAEAVVRARQFISPIDGIVVAVQKRKGEPVIPNETIFRVVDTDSLEVTGQVDVADAWRLRPGQSVRIVPEIGGADLAVEREVFEGKVAFVDTHIDPLTKTCKVTARAENRDGMLRSGMEVRMELLPVREPAPGRPARGRPSDVGGRTAPVPGVGQLDRGRGLDGR